MSGASCPFSPAWDNAECCPGDPPILLPSAEGKTFNGLNSVVLREGGLEHGRVPLARGQALGEQLGVCPRRR